MTIKRVIAMLLVICMLGTWLPVGAGAEETCEHDYSHWTYAPTCTEEGYTYHQCNLCGHTYSDNIVPAKGHTPDIPEPTETEYQRCTECLQVIDYLYLTGNAGQGVTFCLDRDGTMTFSGTGDIELVTHAYLDEARVTRIIIDEGIRFILKDALPAFPNLTSISFPNTLEAIGEAAFDQCTKLTDVEFPDSLERIGSGAFQLCTGLTELSFPEHTVIESNAFADCTGLKNVVLPINGRVMENAFARCTNLTDAQLHGIPTGAVFASCTALKNVTIGSDVPSMEGNLFAGCTALTAIHIPGNVKTMSYTFQGCTNLKDVTMDYGVERIGERTFSDCKAMESIVIPASVKEIGDSAFWISDVASKLTSIRFEGCAPVFESSALHGLGHSTICYYPSGNSTWNSDALSHHGSTTVRWQSYAHTHNYVTTVTTPGCTTEGYTDNTCTVCHYSYRTDEKAALGHSMSGGACILCGSESELIVEYFGRDALSKLDNSVALLYAYDRLVEGIRNLESNISVYDGVHPLSTSELSMILDVYDRDHTDAFWINSWSYSIIGDNVTSVSPVYTMTGSQLTAARAAVQAEVEEILAGISPSMSDYEKELYLHDTLAARIEYVDAPNAHNIYGALVEGLAVCEGYAEALQYLLQQVGIQSFIMQGSSKGVAHAWNAVKIGGKFYHVDVTWDDQGDELFHAYFNLTDARIKEDHSIYGAVFALPVCNSEDAFYFTGKETLLTTYDAASVGKLLKDNNGKVHVYIPGDVDGFLTWFDSNIVPIAQAAGVTGGFSYGFNHLSREVILIIPELQKECTHNYSSAVFVPGCTIPGYTIYTCTLCGHSYQTSNPAPGHTFDSGVVTTQPDCTNPGVRTFTCSVCGETETEAVSAKGHTEVTDEAVAPTCTTAGLTEGKHCGLCNAVLIAQSVVPATGHSYESVTKAPTCVEKGYTTYTCHCGDSYKDNFVNATGVHIYSGSSDTDCDVCGAVRDLSGTLQLPFTEAEWEVLRLTNEQREAAGLDPLTGYALLQKAGDIRAQELGQLFSHSRPNGTACFTVLDELGIKKNGAAAENIASGYTTPAGVVNAWMNSQGHRENILDPSLGHMTAGNIGTDWVQVFTGARAYTDIQIYLPEALSADPGVSMDELDLVAILSNSATGECYLPLSGSHCQGYNPNVPGDQTVTVSVLGVTTTFSIHVHDWQSGGCVAEKICALCGKTVGAPGNHVYGEWTVTAAPSCTEKGAERRDCTTCDHYETREIAAKGHTQVTDEAVAPTCTATGLTEGKHCSVCHVVLVKQDVIPVKEHSWDSGVITKAPTEETAGEKTFTCTVCGKTRKETVPPVAHTHSYESVVTPPTCTEKGYTTHTCACGDSYTDSYVNAKGHTEVTDKAVAPTCTATGLTEGKHCSVCSAVTVEQNVVPAKGHTEVTDKAVAPTCTATGLTEGKHCSVCSAVLVKQNVVPAKGHTEVTDKAVAPTCTATGLTEGKHCSVCNEVLTAQTVVPAKGHSWDSGEITRVPTENTEGERKFTCTVCGNTRTESIPVLDHVHNYKSVVTAPTCTEKGYTTHTCACGNSYTDSYVDAKGHTEVTDKAVAPTCTASGLTEGKHCSVCNEVLTAQTVVPAKGHSWDGDTCTVCGAIQTGYRISVTGADLTGVTHAWVDGKKYALNWDGADAFVSIPHTDATNLVVYTFNDPNAADVHTKYPTDMRVWMLKFENGAYNATYIPELDNLLQYYGSSIRIVGVKGIRLITGIDKDLRNSLINGGVAGYTLVEYGTALAWVSNLDENNPLVLGPEYTKSNFAYKRGVADPIFGRDGNLILYTNVLVGFNDDQCIPDIAMRPYIILEDADGRQITIYGGEVERNIGYIAWQNRTVFKPGSASYDYVWGIIHHVYGDQFDADYKGE